MNPHTWDMSSSRFLLQIQVSFVAKAGLVPPRVFVLYDQLKYNEVIDLCLGKVRGTLAGP